MPFGPSIEEAAYGRAVNLLKAREGERRNAQGQHITYLDSVGKLTGGIGHLIKAGDPVQYQRLNAPIPQAQVDAWFKADIAASFAEAKNQARALGKYNADMIAALTSANFQLGDFDNVFKNTFKVLQGGDAKSFISRLWQSAWAKQTPTRVADLVSAVQRNYGVA